MICSRPLSVFSNASIANHDIRLMSQSSWSKNPEISKLKLMRIVSNDLTALGENESLHKYLDQRSIASTHHVASPRHRKRTENAITNRILMTKCQSQSIRNSSNAQNLFFNPPCSNAYDNSPLLKTFIVSFLQQTSS